MIENEKYFLGIFNSKLFWFFMLHTGTVLRGGFLRFKTEYLKPFPIKTINPVNKQDKQIHDQIVELVELMLDLNKQLATARLAEKKEQLQAQIAFTDKQIDKLVYQLYNLTEEEIRLIEEG
jgi:adenine-specific DNA-methyltransferase